MRTACLFLAALCLAGCVTNPATGRRQVMLMSEQEEIQLGRQSDAEVRKQMGVYADPELQQYVDTIGQRLARQAHRPGLPWTFTVVDSPAVNAFALPGGFIYVTRGILPFLRDEAELAAVLGHEVGHVDARHSAAAYSRQTLVGGGLGVLGVFVPEARPFQGLADVAFGLLFLKNSRENELEADHLGVGYAAAAGWDPGAMPDLLGTLGRLDQATGSSRGVPNWALTHPPAADRVAKVQAAVASARTTGSIATNRAALERHLDGLVYGDSREKGIVRGNEFLHPVLRFALRFPEGWEIVNGDQQVSASEREDGQVAMVLELATNASGSIDDAARSGMTKAGFEETAGQHAEINGLSAYIGTFNGTTTGGARVTARAAYIRADGRTFLLAGLAPESDFSRVESAFAASIRSFRSLSQAEADRIQPDRVDFRVVRPGETWASIASGPAEHTVKPATLAIMNGVDPSAPPRAGERVRIVVGG
jgi:predicted Zn-dependent protease